jgi:hypothetical protein
MLYISVDNGVTQNTYGITGLCGHFNTFIDLDLDH